MKRPRGGESLRPCLKRSIKAHLAKRQRRELQGGPKARSGSLLISRTLCKLAEQLVRLLLFFERLLEKARRVVHAELSCPSLRVP